MEIAGTARPLRNEVSGGRYHLTDRGNERRAIYRDGRDREQFLELLAELPSRFGCVLQAYVLVSNHSTGGGALRAPESRMRLTGLSAAVGGVDSVAVGGAIGCFDKRQAKEKQRAGRSIQNTLSNS